jgi:hypothetical protein
VQKGRLDVLTQDPQISLWIQKNGERVIAADYNESPLALQLPEAQKSFEEFQPKDESSNLNFEDLQKIVAAQEPQFYRCYTQLIQTNPEAKGTAVLEFTVEPSGKIKNFALVSKTLKQPSFITCVEQVLLRVKIRPFLGAEIATAFPLTFE